MVLNKIDLKLLVEIASIATTERLGGVLEGTSKSNSQLC